MGESLIFTPEMKKPGDGFSVPVSSNLPLFRRRIEFHPARKPFSGFSNSGGDFHIETLNPSSDSQLSNAYPSSSASTGKKSEKVDVFEHGLDPELSFEITFRRIGAGLQNLGNTCFLNSVLQCLTYTEPLAAYLQSGKHKSSCRTAGFCALCAIQNHVRRALQSTGRILAPNDLVMNLRCISRNFRNARQEDAHEYMVNLLESMHKCCLPSGVPSQSPGAYEKSLVHKIFGGRLRSQVKCTQCSYCSNTFDPFLDLSLEISKTDSLRKALSHFTAMEQLDGGQRQYQCQRCKQKVKALKQLTVDKAPYVLTIHLKRFDSHIAGQKIDKKVEFGPTLDLKPFVSGPHEGDLKYTLYGVLVHAGWSTHSGHYYCFVRTSSGMWHSLDDNRVVQVSERTVLEQKAYMLFYFRDRRSLATKKPVNVVLKEHTEAIANESKECSVSTPGPKETIQNVMIGNRSSISDSSVTIAQRDALSGNSSKDHLSKEVSVHKTTNVVRDEHLPLLKGPLVKPSLKEPLLKDSLNAPYTNDQFVAEGIPQAALSSVICGGTTSHLRTASTSDAKVNSQNGNEESKNSSVPPLSTPTICNGPQNPVSEKLLTDTMANKISGVFNEKPLNEEPCKRVSESNPELLGSVMLLDHPSTQKSQNGGISNETGPSISNGHNHKEALVRQCRKKVAKSKKMLGKCHIANMHLGSKLLLRASLSLRKKKHKRSKFRNLELKGFSGDDLIEQDCMPSTSDKTKMVALDSTGSRRKGKKSGRKKRNGCVSTKEDVKDSSNNSLNNVTDGDLRLSNGEGGAVLATIKPPQNTSSSRPGENQWEFREPNSLQDKNRLTVQNSLISMLTRGLGDIIVPRWDETKSPSSQGSNGGQSISIGYVPDEWDEEYDRGKRKKVRSSKNSYGEGNPFQEVATMKTQFKKIKMDQTSSGNQPFRI